MIQTFIVTGASRGLGLEFIKKLAARGDIIFACARNLQGAKELQTLVDNKKVFGIQLDANSAESIKSAAAEIAFQGTRRRRRVDQQRWYSCAELNKLFETNVIGVNEVTKALVPILRKRGQDKMKKVINVSSILGSIDHMTDDKAWGFSVAYCVSKAAVNILTKMTANKLVKENFLVYASHPGWCQTELGGNGAPVTPADSIRGQLAKIDSLTLKDNGEFFN
ncbi:MAG: hypothetical protein EXX96DRAFT_603775 [Benjaminiella poitrasii]|nr:MAG: hypothetical protein EXX96DRAFT_603775 [Benjaminiella poitrasii]